MTWPVLVFDIETIPDLAGLRLLRATPADTSDAALWSEVQAERAAAGKSDFLPHHLQRVLVVSCVFRSAEGLRVHSFVDREPDGQSEEARVIQQFFTTVERKIPQLVSWNGGGFDLPVLHWRACATASRRPSTGISARTTASSSGTTTSTASTCATST